MIDKAQIDPEKSELRLPLWVVTDEKGFRERGIPGALRIFFDELQGKFLDLFTKEDIAKEYLRKASFSNWRAVELVTLEQVHSAVLACERRGCLCVGLDCIGPQSGGGRFFTIRQFLDFVEEEKEEERRR